MRKTFYSKQRVRVSQKSEPLQNALKFLFVQINVWKCIWIQYNYILCFNIKLIEFTKYFLEYIIIGNHGNKLSNLKICPKFELQVLYVFSDFSDFWCNLWIWKTKYRPHTQYSIQDHKNHHIKPVKFDFQCSFISNQMLV